MRPPGSGGTGPSAALPLLDDSRYRLRRGALHLAPRRPERDPRDYSDGLLAVAAWTAPLLAHASRMRFPWLVAVTAALFLADVLIPDLIPLVDELLLGLLTVALASIRRRRTA